MTQLHVAIFGASGMIGHAALLECIDSPDVASIVSVGRRACGVTHAKLREVVVRDIGELTTATDALATCNATFFCVGVSSIGMTEEAYHRATYDLTMSVARTMLRVAPQSTFIYVSGQATDSTERGSAMWARVKGKTENALLALGFPAAYMFRPGFIQPMRGVRSRTALYQAAYTITAPLTPLIRRLFPNSMLTSVGLGRAMIRSAVERPAKKILEVRDINELASSTAR